MKKKFLPLLILASFGALSQTIDSTWLVNNYNKSEVLIPMRDGIKLFTTIYSPKNTSEKHPILMMRTPYSVAPYGKEMSKRLYATHWSNYVREQYIIVMQDVRGKYMSEGEFEDVRPFLSIKKSKKDIDEASDSYDAIDWLIKNVKGNNGKVGVFGISYPGFYSTMAALSAHPALKAVSPQAPVTDWYMGDDFHHNGAFALMDAFSFYSSFGKPRPVPTTKHAKGFDFPEKDAYNFYLKQGALRNFSQYMDSVKYWNELMSHPLYDNWWQSRDARRACYNLKPAMLIVGGTFDAEDCYGAWNLYKAIEKQSPKTNNRIVMGPWYHGGWQRADGSYLGNVRFGSKTSMLFQNEIELRFFNSYLKDKRDDISIAEANIFFTGENGWRTFDSWPPRSMEERKLYLNHNGQLSFNKPDIKESYSSYVSNPKKPVPYDEPVLPYRTREYMINDQRFTARRPDVLVFETNVLEDELTLAGPLIATLKVSLSTTDADFIVKLIDVFPDNFSYDKEYCCKGPEKEVEMAGYQMLVRAEIMRGKFRNSFEKPEPFFPGKTETVKFQLPDVAHTFKKGHKLMVQIQSTWFPLFDRNPQQFTDIYTCKDEDFISSEIKIHHASEATSHLILSIIPNQ
jgi:uncharacterized protein